MHGEWMLEPWTLDELIGVFDVESVGEGHFRGETYPKRAAPAEGARAVVDGSQLLGQSIVAAHREEPERVVKSAHMIFSRPVLGPAPVELRLERNHAGRSFASVTATVEQGGKLCARGVLLMDRDAPDLIHHDPALPEVGKPGEGFVYDALVEGREVRVAGEGDYREPGEVAPPHLDVWMRYAKSPEEPAVRQALLAQACGRHLIGTAMRPHEGYGESMAHRTLSTGVLTLTVRFHQDRPLDDWLLYSHDALHAGRGLSDGKGRIFDADGTLLASFEQESMIRAMPEAQRGKRENAM